MKKINKYIQYIIFISMAICLVASLYDSRLIIWILFAALPIGISQYLTSFIDVVLNKGNSLYKYHFILSSVVLLIIYGLSDYSPIRHMPNFIEDIFTFIGFGGSFGLACYYWVITYRKEPKFLKKDHDVFEL